mgnify:CR=1 FL=1
MPCKLNSMPVHSLRWMTKKVILLNKMRFTLISMIGCCALTLAAAQTFAPDTKPAPPITGTGDYTVTVDKPLYKAGQGPRVTIDEAHHNYQTIADRFQGFANLLTADGARVLPNRSAFSAETLAQTDVLVICNALSAKNAQEKATINKWALPAPEALTDDEIEAITTWVKNGGSLLLIADHMPFPNAVDKLASSLGIAMGDNFAFDAAFTYKPGDMNLIKFYEKQPATNTGKLHSNAVVRGRNPSEHIPFVVTFTGSAFRVKPGAQFTPVLELGEGTNVAWPSDHADISMKTPFTRGAGLYQGGLLRTGKGRVAVFGEASMFSVNYAEWVGNYPTGFHNPDAPHNKQFVLNVFHWLAKSIK